MPSGPSVPERFSYNGAALVSEVFSENPGNLANPGNPSNLVLLHGWGADRDSLRGIAILFQHTHRIHLIDLPGFGDAPPPPSDWGTLEYADLVQQYLHERSQGHFVLVGHSFGSRVSLRLASRRLPLLQAVVLIAAPGLPANATSLASLRRRAVRALRQVLIATKGVTGQKAIDWHTRTFGSKDYLAAAEMKPILVKTVNENLTESAQAVACPALLLYGTDDTETPLWLGLRYRELMASHATLSVLPHKDHHTIYQSTGAHLCAFRIREFLSAFAPNALGASARFGPSDSRDPKVGQAGHA